MDRILIILKTNGPRASSAKYHNSYWYMQQISGELYKTCKTCVTTCIVNMYQLKKQNPFISYPKDACWKENFTRNWVLTDQVL